VSSPAAATAAGQVGEIASATAAKASDPNSQATPAKTDSVAKSLGRLRRISSRCGRSTIPAAPRYPTTPRPAIGGEPITAPPAATASAVSSIGRPRRAATSTPLAIRVRSIVGHSVTSVPSTVSATQPNKFSAACAMTNRSWILPGSAGFAIATPSPAPIARHPVAAT
jgi:hypothetical protein